MTWNPPGVDPDLDAMEKSAPFSTSTLTQSTCPLNDAVQTQIHQLSKSQCGFEPGVLPLLSIWSKLTPFSINHRTQSTRPFRAASYTHDVNWNIGLKVKEKYITWCTSIVQRSGYVRSFRFQIFQNAQLPFLGCNRNSNPVSFEGKIM